MNLTELARILRITPNELKEKLPKLGFDIGAKAIKIDKRIAQKIIEDWPKLLRRLREMESVEEKEEETDGEPQEKKEITIPSQITVKEFASTLGLPLNKILAELMKSGIFISLNEKIDADTASIIGSDLGFEIIIDKNFSEESAEKEDVSQIIKKGGNLSPRPPVIVVMGHVDHGKTKLLDAIRKTDIVSGEAGGITQHIGAYQVKRKGKPITFIDTPGHEAFTAMRGRGAKIADIAILVVAADDGVKPQTTEAFQIIKSAKIPFIVAINKIDKPEADINKTKQELSSQLNITPEDWGGKTVCAPVSALTGDGIDSLLDMVLLTAEMEEENIKADPKARAMGTIIESRVDKGEGPVATILIQNGELKTGDILSMENRIIGKTRSLKNWKGENIDSAGPSVPAKIIGMKIAPAVGDIIKGGEDADEKLIKKTKTSRNRGSVSIKNIIQEEEKEGMKKINLIIKSDVLGSGEAIEESLEKINTAEIKVKIISKGLGNISEGDIKNAEAAKAQVIGFNVKFPPAMEELAREKNIIVKTYTIIYHLINDLKEQMEELLDPEVKRTDLGKLKVLAVFKTEKNEQVVGGKVIEGKTEKDSFIEVMRDKKIIERGKLIGLKSGKEEVANVEEGQECGIQYQGEPVIQEGDILHFYKEEKIKKIL